MEKDIEPSKRVLLAKLAVGASVAYGATKLKAKANENEYITKNGKHHWCMVIDLRKCVGCQSCTMACKIENNTSQGTFRTWVSDVETKKYPYTKRVFIPRLCNHCEEPSCVPVCPTKATFKRKEDGLVLVDSKKCIGCAACVTACPYDSRYIDPISKTVDKCTFCAHRLEQGLQPACSETCIGKSRIFGDLLDHKSEVYKLVKKYPVSVLKPRTGNKPNVFYIGLNDLNFEKLQQNNDQWTVEFEKYFDKELLFKGIES